MNEHSTDLLVRLEAIEIRVAHQDMAIADLNEVITEQWNRIAALERHLAMLRDELQNMATEPGAHERPPHY